MATTYEKIATTTLGTAASSIDFTSIAGTYTDLRVVFTWQPTAALNLFIRFEYIINDNINSNPNLLAMKYKYEGMKQLLSEYSKESKHFTNIMDKL
jgi:hypothetical protein